MIIWSKFNSFYRLNHKIDRWTQWFNVRVLWNPSFQFLGTWHVKIVDYIIFCLATSIETNTIVLRNSALFTSYYLTFRKVDIHCGLTPHCDFNISIWIISNLESLFFFNYSIFKNNWVQRVNIDHDANHIYCLILLKILNEIN